MAEARLSKVSRLLDVVSSLLRVLLGVSVFGAFDVYFLLGVLEVFQKVYLEICCTLCISQLHEVLAKCFTQLKGYVSHQYQDAS